MLAFLPAYLELLNAPAVADALPGDNLWFFEVMANLADWGAPDLNLVEMRRLQAGVMGNSESENITLSSMLTSFCIKNMLGNIDAIFFMVAGKTGFYSRKCPVFQGLTEKSMPSISFFNSSGNGIGI